MQPLKGVTVVSLEQAVAAPLASRHLADLGARVIKIERPDCGDFARGYDRSVRGLSSHFVWLNRTKESVTLDLKSAPGAGVLWRLLEGADVFIQNLAPGAVERLGFSDAELRRRYPALIVCHVSGYGREGPYRDKKAYDLLIQAEAGLLAVTGTEQEACKVGISAADIAAGMYAFSGILTALFTRERTGAGEFVEVSLFDCLAEWMGYPMYYAAYGGVAPARTGARHATIAPYGPFHCQEGGQIILGIQNEREWLRFCGQVLRKPGLADDARFSSNADRVANYQQLRSEIETVFENLSAASVAERLDKAAIAYGRLNTLDDLWQHPQLQERGRWRDIDSSVGPLRALLPPVVMSRCETALGPIPELGQHTVPVLEEFGFSRDEIAQLRASQVI